MFNLKHWLAAELRGSAEQRSQSTRVVEERRQHDLRRMDVPPRRGQGETRHEYARRIPDRQGETSANPAKLPSRVAR